METLKLVLVTFGFLVVVVGFFYVAFVLLGKKGEPEESCSTENSNARAYACGCGTKACGLPLLKEK